MRFLLQTGAVAFQLAVLLAAAVSTSATDHPCTLWRQQLSCTNTGLTLPPPGVWPNVTTLYLDNNPITKFTVNSFSGLPDLAYLSSQFTQLTALDFADLLDVPLLETLVVQNNNIASVKGIPDGESLQHLESVYLSGNNISTLDHNFLLNAPLLQTLSLSGNPIAVKVGQPVVVHPALKNFYLGMKTDLRDVTSSLLCGLPNLQSVSLLTANITSVAGAFVTNRLLVTVTLTNNNITQIVAGTFASEGVLKTIYLEGNPLERFNVEAVDAAMVYAGAIWIEDTPLACSCGYERLHWWSKTRGVTINAWCRGQPGCNFTQTTSPEPPTTESTPSEPPTTESSPSEPPTTESSPSEPPTTESSPPGPPTTNTAENRCSVFVVYVYMLCFISMFAL